MSIIDTVLIGFVLIGVYSGYREGLILSIFSLFAVIVGVLLDFKLMGEAITFLMGRFYIGDQVLPFVAFAFVFLLVVIGVNLLGRILKLTVSATFLGIFDKIAGGVFGAIKTIFMLSVMLWIAESLKFKVPDNLMSDSSLLNPIANVAPAASKWISAVIPYFSNTF